MSGRQEYDAVTFWVEFAVTVVLSLILMAVGHLVPVEFLSWWMSLIIGFGMVYGGFWFVMWLSEVDW